MSLELKPGRAGGMYVSFTVFGRKVGDWLDARDSDGTWCVAQVVRIETEVLRVHFQGYSSRFDEDIRLESSKVCRDVM